MSIQIFSTTPNGLINTSSAGSPLASSTTLTDVSPTPIYTLPAGTLVAGSVMRFTAFGVLSTTATPTILLGIYYGGVAGTALVTTGAITTGSGVTNVPWRIQCETFVRTAGTSATMMTQGYFDLGTSVSAVSHLPMPNTALATVGSLDTTAAKALTVGAQWSANSASNTLTCHGFIAELLV